MTLSLATPSGSLSSAGDRTLRLLRPLLLVLLCSATAGCGVLAAPCRVTSAALKMVPLVGHVAAVPTDACAAVID
jgi:hypothetical protein